MSNLPAGLKAKVKNALRDISRGEELGTALSASYLPASANGKARRVYRAGRFRLLYRRRHGSVWIDALTLEPIPGFALGERKSAP